LIASTVLFVHPRPSTVVVKLFAEHDLIEEKHYEALFQRLVATNELVVVDLTQAVFIDSSFIATLFRAGKHARTCGTAFRIQIARESRAWRALSCTGALESLEVATSLEEALSEPAQDASPLVA
jgi:anti-anti-sigma regulatory factor